MDQSLQALAIGVATGAFYPDALKDAFRSSAFGEDHGENTGAAAASATAAAAADALPPLPPSPGMDSDASFDCPENDEEPPSSLTTEKDLEEGDEDEREQTEKGGGEPREDCRDEESADVEECSRQESSSLVAAKALRSEWLNRRVDARAFSSMVRRQFKKKKNRYLKEDEERVWRELHW